MNLNEQPVALESGTHIADLSQVEVLGEIPTTDTDSTNVKQLDDDDVFNRDEIDLGRTDIIMHHIDTDGARSVRQPLRRYPPAHQEAISQHVNNMLKQGTTEPASSPWASNVVLVKNKNGSLRCCTDYR